MSECAPQLILRMGTHAEKDYFEKTIKFLDGIIIGANLIEATPGATASLLHKFSGAKNAKPYYIDPMSYAFGNYVDFASGNENSDLSWIKSEQKVEKKIISAYKKSYKKLANEFGEPFINALQINKAITPADLNDSLINSMCESFKNYQLNRIRTIFSNDEKYKEFSENIPQPAAIFAPYFYIDPAAKDEWFELNLKFISKMAHIKSEVDTHGIVCIDKRFISDPIFKNWIEKVAETGIKGIWFWFSKFYEEDAKFEDLLAYKELVQFLSSKKIKVFSLHGGFFSLALCKYGLQGISHGVGYGEQKDVVPIIGQSTPTVRYYHPALYRRLGVPEIERCFNSLNIKTPEDFRKKVCSCAICSGVVSNSIEEFSQFGESHYSTEKAKRMAQTPAAAKRCRFHFLLRRIIERNWLKEATNEQIRDKFIDALNNWGKQPTLQNLAFHLERWMKIFQ